MNGLTRRAFVAGAAALTAGAAPGEPALFRRLAVGHLAATAISDGLWQRPIDAAFIRNAAPEAVRAALATAAMPPDHLTIPFAPLLIEDRGTLTLIDAGTGGQIAPSAGRFLENLAAAGYDAKSVRAVLISNFHPDHINGLKTKDNALVFPNAEILVPEREWAFWSDEALAQSSSDMIRSYYLNARRIFGDMAARVRRFSPGREIVPGITAIDAPGHTPGHVAYAVASGAAALLVLCDTTNNPLIFARHPDWQPVLDQDGPTAVATRRRLLDMASAERALVHGYHFPYPAFGRIARQGAGYEFEPAA